MSPLLRSVLLWAGLAACAPVPAAPPMPLNGSMSMQPATLMLYVGQAHVLNEGEVRRIAIGNGKVIQATALDERQVLIVPEAPGQSTLHIWGPNGPERLLVVTVLAADVGRLVAEVRGMLGEAGNLRVRPVGDKLLVEGENLTEEQGVRLAEVAKRYPQLVNLASKVGLERMIAMDVRMVEIRRDSLENIGVRWSGSAAGPTFGIVGDLRRSSSLTPGGSGDGAPGLEIRPRVGPFASVLSIASSVTSMINLMCSPNPACRAAAAGPPNSWPVASSPFPIRAVWAIRA